MPTTASDDNGRTPRKEHPPWWYTFGKLDGNEDKCHFVGPVTEGTLKIVFVKEGTQRHERRFDLYWIGRDEAVERALAPIRSFVQTARDYTSWLQKQPVACEYAPRVVRAIDESISEYFVCSLLDATSSGYTVSDDNCLAWFDQCYPAPVHEFETVMTFKRRAVDLLKSKRVPRRR
jgi:hypothetical protein